MPRTSVLPESELIKKLREDAGLSRKLLAAKASELNLHLGTGVIYKAERGQMVSSETIDALARLLNVDFNRIVKPEFRRIPLTTADVAGPIASPTMSRSDLQGYLACLASEKRFSRWDDSEFIPENASSYETRTLSLRARRYDMDQRSVSKSFPVLPVLLDPSQTHSLLLGKPGSGKTTILERIQRDLALGAQDGAPIPVFCELGRFRHDNTIWDVMTDFIQPRGGHGWTAELIRKSFESNAIRFCILADGLNEVSDQFRPRCVNALFELLQNGNQKLIITCRKRDFEETPILQKVQLDTLLLEDLSEQAVSDHLDRRLGQTGDLARVAVYSSLSRQLQELARTPVNLELVATIAEGQLEPNLTRGELYSLFIRRRLQFEDEKHSRPVCLDEEAIGAKRLILASLAHRLVTEGAFWMSQARRTETLGTLRLTGEGSTSSAYEELLASGLLRLDEAEHLSFAHQTFRDYLAAEFLVSLLDGDPRLSPISMNRADIAELANDDRWHEPLEFLCGIDSKPDEILTSLARHTPLLGGRCLLQSRSPSRKTTVLVSGQLLASFLRSERTDVAGILWLIDRRFRTALSEAVSVMYSDENQQRLTLARIRLLAGRDLQETGRWAEARQEYERTRDEVAPLADKQNRDAYRWLALVLSELGALDDVEGKYSIAAPLHNQALQIALDHAAPLETALICLRCGYNARYSIESDRDWKRAAALFDRACELAEGYGETSLKEGERIVAQSLMGLGKIALEQDRYEAAQPLFSRASLMFTSMNDEFQKAQAMHKVGEALLGLAKLGKADSATAFQQLELSLELKQKRGDLFGIGISFEKLGKWYEQQGRVDEALDHQERSLRVKNAMGGRDKRGVVLSKCAQARLMSTKGAIEQGIVVLDDVLRGPLADLLDDWEMFAEYQQSRGIVLSRKGQFQDALYHAERARYIWQRTNRPVRRSEVDRLIDNIREQLLIEEAPLCSKCGAQLVPVNQGLHRQCARGHLYFHNPKLGSAVLVIQNDEVLLVERKNPPYEGWWTLPAGYVEYCETPQECAIRETKEETGLVIQLSEIPRGLFTFRDDPRADMLLVVYETTVANGTLRPGDDASRAVFFRFDSLPENVAFEGNRQALNDWRQEKGERRMRFRC